VPPHRGGSPNHVHAKELSGTKWECEKKLGRGGQNFEGEIGPLTSKRHRERNCRDGLEIKHRSVITCGMGSARRERGEREFAVKLWFQEPENLQDF